MSMSTVIPRGAARQRRHGAALSGPRKALSALSLTLMLVSMLAHQALAAAPANTPFQNTWQRPDQPVLAGAVSRTWMWGPAAFTEAVQEPYAESPSPEGAPQRTVQYFDKSRMEITNPDADSAADWYVTNGLLVVELMTGRVQVGDNQFEERQPALVNVAGDADDLGGPAYMTIGRVADVAARAEGTLIIERLDRSGKLNVDTSLNNQGITAARYVPETEHTIAEPFWAFMNSAGLVYRDGQYLTDELFPNPFYATGYPVAEAYWAEVKVGGIYRDVLLQCFERRCLTYTPDNPPGWQVEAGNVGRHYYSWRYGMGDGEPAPLPAPDPTPEPTEEPISPTAYLSAGPLAAYTPEAFPLDGPLGIAVDPAGDIVLVQDADGNVLRFNTQGLYLDGFTGQLADNGIREPSKIAIDSAGNYYLAYRTLNAIHVVTPDGVPLQELTDGLNEPTDLVFDPALGRLYTLNLTDGMLNFFTVDAEGNIAKGAFESQDQLTEEGRLNRPEGIGVDGDGNIFVADTANHVIKKFAPTGELVTTFGGPGLEPEDTTSPHDVVVGPDGLVYIVATGDPSGAGSGVKVFEPLDPEATGYRFVTAWGALGSTPGNFRHPSSIALDADGLLYIADELNDRVQVFTTTGDVVDVWTTLTRGELSIPRAIEADADGYLYVTDYQLQKLTVYTPELEFAHEWHVNYPVQMSIRPNNIALGPGRVYVSDSANRRVLVYDRQGVLLDTWQSKEGADVVMLYPAGMALDADGTVYIADSDANRVHRFSPDGQQLAGWGLPGSGPGELNNPIDIAIRDGYAYVTDFGNNRVQQFGLDGSFIRAWGGTGDGAGQFNGPSNLTLDADGYIYVTDYNAGRIQKFTAEGEFYAAFDAADLGLGQLALPTGITVDSAGRLYVVNNRDPYTVVEVLIPAPAGTQPAA